MNPVNEELEQLSIHVARALCMDMIQKANSGHPGAPMGLAPTAYTLFRHFLRHNPENPQWGNRDRFVLSGGHVSSLLYSMLYLFGYGLTLEELQDFRQWGSRTPGHPEYGHTPGVETTTGPLGQGIANAVGMAMAEKHLGAKYNTPDISIIDHHTYVMCGDGDLMEGVAKEAVSLAGHLGLGKLILLYDDNRITIEGTTDIAFTEDVEKIFAAMNWHVQSVADGNDLAAIGQAIEEAKKETGKPSIIRIRTHIAYGSPAKQDTPDAHGAPLGADEIRKVKEFYGLPQDKEFYVPESVLEHARQVIAKGREQELDWKKKMEMYQSTHPQQYAALEAALSGNLPVGWDRDIPQFSANEKAMATRNASGKVLNSIAGNLESLMGGSADLAPSNKTYLSCSGDFQNQSPENRNIRFGIREHAMGSILSGMFLHGGIRPFGGTFLVFADYMRPAIRMASLMKLPVIYVFTHDSVAVGEDGPTHQPVEHLASLRAIPELQVIRPADANETALAWKQALETKDAPTALIFSRQNLPILEITKEQQDAFAHGAYILHQPDTTPDMILIGTGSEVHVCMEAAAILEKEHNIRTSVVSMPSWEAFDRAPADYREKILPSSIKKRLAVEAGISMGWEKYLGDQGKMVGINSFGVCAPGSVVLERLGINTDNVVSQAISMLK